MIKSENILPRLNILTSSFTPSDMSVIIGLDYSPSKMRTTDVLTKPVPKPDFVKHRLNFQLFSHSVSYIKGEY